MPAVHTGFDTNMAMNFSPVKTALTLFFVFVFVWQCVMSFQRFLDKKTTFTFNTDQTYEQKFPGITICPMPFVFTYDPSKYSNVSIQEQVSDIPRVIDLAYQHGRTSGRFNENVTDPNWETTVAFDPFSRNLTICYTYMSDKQFRNGFESTLLMTIYLREVEHFMALVHPPGDNLVCLSKIFSRDVILISAVDDNLKYEYKHCSYEVGHRRNIILGNSQSPCSKEKQNVYDCIEGYIEGQANCSLPWRKSKSAYDTTCSDAAKFKEIYSYLMIAGEEQIYERTGCMSSCYFMMSL